MTNQGGRLVPSTEDFNGLERRHQRNSTPEEQLKEYDGCIMAFAWMCILLILSLSVILFV